MKIVQLERTAILRQCNMKQHEKRCKSVTRKKSNPKRLQHEKKQPEKSATQKKCNTERNATQHETTHKKVQHEKSTRVQDEKRTRKPMV